MLSRSDSGTSEPSVSRLNLAVQGHKLPEIKPQMLSLMYFLKIANGEITLFSCKLMFFYFSGNEAAS